MSESLTKPEDPFFCSIREILAEARRKAATSVNFIMVEAYWRIGERIIEQEQKGDSRAAYGQALIKELSRRLSDEFGSGFSIANLKNFRQFYLTFPDSAKGYALRSELGWTHYRLIMRVEDPKARSYYLNEAASQGWTSRQLERNIRSGWHQRLLKAPDADTQAADAIRPESIFKDPYVLEFLNLRENTKHHEREIESALIDNLQAFLLELGRGFSFVGRQFRISSETSHFYIDLVFYNYLLKCFVLIDLKIEKLSHQDIGQMDIYPVRYSHEHVPLRLRSAISQGQKFLRRIHKGPAQAERRARPRKRSLNCFSPSIGAGVLRGIQKPSRCHQTRKVSQNGLGQTLHQKSNRSLSHGVNVRMFDDLKRGDDDNPTLGIILCADKDETIVRYSVLRDNEQLFAAKYLHVLPSEEQLARELEARHVLDFPTEGDEK